MMHAPGGMSRSWQFARYDVGIDPRADFKSNPLGMNELQKAWSERLKCSMVVLGLVLW